MPNCSYAEPLSAYVFLQFLSKKLTKVKQHDVTLLIRSTKNALTKNAKDPLSTQFCSLEPKIGQLERIEKKKGSFGKICVFLLKLLISDGLFAFNEALFHFNRVI